MKWYEHPDWTKFLPKLRTIAPQFRYHHRGECLQIFDEFGIVANLRSWDAAMDFKRIVEAVTFTRKQHGV